MADVWFAKQAVVKLGLDSAVPTIDNSTALDTYFGSGTATSITAFMKDVTITEPMGDVDKIDLMGEDINGFQNAVAEEKPPAMGEVSGTLVLDGDEVIETYFYDAGTAITGGLTRYRPGKASVRKLAMLINLNDGTDEVNIAMRELYPTAKETKVTGADGHFEITFTAKCLAKNFYGPEFKD